MTNLDQDAEQSEMEVENNTSNLETMRNSILNSVSNSDGFFRSQQVGEPDLTYLEKREIADDLLKRNVPLFLQKYWKFVKLEDITYFESHNNYEVNFYVAEIRKFQNSRKNKVSVRNRRYEALKKMVSEGSYFSDGEMKNRNPFLFDQLIGQHLTENERVDAYKMQNKDEGFSSFLIGQLERNVENCLFQKQKDEDEAVEEEEDDDEDHDVASDESEIEEESKTVPVTGMEKSLLRSEFTNIMYENFLAGKDKEFDYSAVDNNTEYDSVQQRDLDEEEKYFDEDTM